MRWMIAALALGMVAACDGSATVSNDTDAPGTPDAYTMQVNAAADVQTYLVTTPDGRTVGARAAEGVSALMDTSRAQALAGEPMPDVGEDLPQVMSLRLPGFEMSINGTDDEVDGENGSVALSIGGEQNVQVRADEGGPGEADDRAYVRITGADEAAVRDFINDAEELSPETKSEMLAALNLN